jgi:flagellar protein FlaG
MKFHRTRCEFSYHEETKRVSIKVFDKDTEEVIREIPPEEALEMVEKMWELAGLLIDERR